MRGDCLGGLVAGEGWFDTGRRGLWPGSPRTGGGRLQLLVDPAGGDCGGFLDGVVLGFGGVGWEVECVVGAGDDVEGVVGFRAVAGWFDSALRKIAGRLTTNGSVGQLTDDMLEFG